MAALDETGLKRQIKSGEFQNAYLIYGEESYLKEYYVSQMKNKIVDETFSAFNLHTFDGKDADPDDIFKDAQMLPMMSEYNLVLVKDYPIEKSANAVKMLEEYLADPSESTVLIFWYDAEEPDIKSAKFKRVIKAFDKAGVCVRLDKRSEREAAKLLVSGAKKRGAVLSADNAAYLITVSGNDLKTLLNELDKLSNFVNGGEITKSIIDNMATKCLQARIYDLSKHIASANPDRAFSVLDTLFSMKEEPIIILSVIGGIYIDMYRVKCAKTAGFSYDEVAKHYNYKGREFALKNASRDCANLSEEQLRNALDAICDTDRKMKSTSADKRLLLEELTAKLILISRENKYD